MATKYIEARPGEKWRDVTRLFVQWLQLHVPTLDSFGYSEDDPIEHNGVSFFALSIPDRHGEKVALFEVWAKTTDRVFGALEKAQVVFSNGTTAPAREREANAGPPWLK